MKLPSRARALLLLGLAATACGPGDDSHQPLAASGGWREFEGTWTAAGSRHIISLGAGRRASSIELRGPLVLAGPGRPGVGFHAELIALVDSATGLVARSVWTDERGDQIYSELAGQGTMAHNRVTGTFLGGTGRYAGVTGSCEFSWIWVLEGEDGAIEGRAVELKGRVQGGLAASDSPR